MSKLDMHKILTLDSIMSMIRPVTFQQNLFVLIGTMSGILGLWKIQGKNCEMVEIIELESPVSIVCDIYYYDDYAVTYLSTYNQEVYMVKITDSGLDIRMLGLKTVINRTLITDKSIIMSGAELYVAKHTNGIIDMSSIIGCYAPDDTTFKVSFTKGKHIYQTTHDGLVYKVSKREGQLYLQHIPSLIADAATGFVTKSGLYTCVASVHGYNEQYKKGSLCRVYKETAEDQWSVTYEQQTSPTSKEFPYPDVNPIQDYGGSISLSPNKFIIVTENGIRTYTHSYQNDLRTSPTIYKNVMFYTTYHDGKACLYITKTT